MSSKKRVQRCFDGIRDDRCPIDFLSTPEMETLLIKELGLIDKEDMYRYFGSDFRRVHPMPRGNHLGTYYRHLFLRALSENTFIDNWGIAWKKMTMPSGDVYYDVVDAPLKHVRSVNELDDIDFPSASGDWDFSGLKQAANEHKVAR